MASLLGRRQGNSGGNNNETGVQRVWTTRYLRVGRQAPGQDMDVDRQPTTQPGSLLIIRLSAHCFRSLKLSPIFGRRHLAFFVYTRDLGRDSNLISALPFSLFPPSLIHTSPTLGNTIFKTALHSCGPVEKSATICECARSQQYESRFVDVPPMKNTRSSYPPAPTSMRQQKVVSKHPT